MRIVRYGAPGAERPGLMDREGRVRDLSAAIPDWTPAQLAPAALAPLSALDPQRLPLVAEGVRLGVPLSGIGKFLAIGLNYADHAAESELPLPAEPVMFTKAISCLCGPDDPVVLPKGSLKTDWEVELGVVIGRRARYVEPGAALQYVAGYCLLCDVSEREYQLERGGTWDKGKGCDSFGPVGPWIVTPDELEDPQAVRLALSVNGERCQDGNTAAMIFPVAVLVSTLSRYLTLEAGDLIATGTPAGVGVSRRPPRFLRAGDRLELEGEGLGAQRRAVIPWSPG
ncbi:MAG: fumarylacetoacetate hydrolase family protein [Proteobacteria bacterium]|nr:fumarylacetoacetate hydrolase family protein [Pseudomonadota bacterium]